MNLGERLMAALEFKTVFTARIAGFAIPITETVIVSWIVMAILIIFSLLLTRRLSDIPKKSQIFLEAFIGGLDSFGKDQFGSHWKTFVPYLGTLFLFLLVANIIPVLTPIEAFGFVPPFEIKPPTRDINVTAACAVMTIAIVIFSGFRARGAVGWFKHLAHPIPMMLPFNLMEFVIRPLSLCLRLFGNILGAYIIMLLVEAIAPIGVPPFLSLYFDFLDGLIQALVFAFLSTLFIAEAIE